MACTNWLSCKYSKNSFLLLLTGRLTAKTNYVTSYNGINAKTPAENAELHAELHHPKIALAFRYDDGGESLILLSNHLFISSPLNTLNCCSSIPECWVRVRSSLCCEESHPPQRYASFLLKCQAVTISYALSLQHQCSHTAVSRHVLLARW